MRTFCELRNGERFRWSERGNLYIKLNRAEYQLMSNPDHGEPVPMRMYYRTDDPHREVIPEAESARVAREAAWEGEVRRWGDSR